MCGNMKLTGLNVITKSNKNVGMIEACSLKLEDFMKQTLFYTMSLTLASRRCDPTRAHYGVASHVGASSSGFESADCFDVSKAISNEYPRFPIRLFNSSISSRPFSPDESDQWRRMKSS